MAARHWDTLLLYGHTWRKDFFRCLVNVNFSGPHVVAALDRSGDLEVIAVDPWDAELISESGLRVSTASSLEQALASRAAGRAAIAGMELMEARFLDVFTSPESATFDVEELRRIKSAEEIACIRKAADLADRGYQHFARTVKPGMAEYELVAEVEAFLKANGAEDNFMLIASGGVEVTGMKPPTDRRFIAGDSAAPW
jgi:Xaa-Pro aminopeptidase